ncbi:MAG TPA: hypothetical protein VFR47_13150 [Anaerolineales bacterium]|nr:hypothetical protein [Anaerolineales bacterium]
MVEGHVPKGWITMEKQEEEARKRRELREKIQKHVDQLPLWDLLQIYLYIQWYRFRERLHWLAWNWFVFQWKLDGEKSRANRRSGFRMKRNRLFLRYGRWALLAGGGLASYIALTMFWQMPYDLWLGIHNLLVVASLLLVAFAGYQHRMFEVPFRFMFLSVILFFAVIMLLYLGSYVVTTTFLADRMVWIPFFYHDYNYHDFESVAAYLNHEDNYRELLGLQFFSLSMSSVMYFAAGGVGYSLKALMDGTRSSSGIAQTGG